MPDGFAGGARPSILVVEDEAALLTLLRYNLEKQGFRVEEATDGQEALLRIAESKPDLVLLDYELPELDGLEVIAALRGDASTRGIPVLLNSAARLSMDEIRRADGFLSKPFTDGLLHAMIERVLDPSSSDPEQRS